MKKLMTCGTVLAFALAAKAEITFDSDCVLYYDFETLDNEGRIVNLVNPGTMDGTVVTKTRSPFPSRVRMLRFYTAATMTRYLTYTTFIR